MRFDLSSRKRRQASLTPLIDVVFLLLVFFMLASRFDVEGALPLVVQAGSPQAAPPSDFLRVVIDDEGETRIADTIVSASELVAAAARAGRDGQSVVVAAAPDATLQAIVDTLEAVERSGVSDAVLERQGAP
ncbi:MAG: biopolymer transporter ExbD [Myxococcota bacterium]|nr:biopolymer transporter ExbD [Myxococcota bacterium]